MLDRNKSGQKLKLKKVLKYSGLSHSSTGRGVASVSVSCTFMSPIYKFIIDKGFSSRSTARSAFYKWNSQIPLCTAACHCTNAQYNITVCNTGPGALLWSEWVWLHTGVLGKSTTVHGEQDTGLHSMRESDIRLLFQIQWRHHERFLLQDFNTSELSKMTICFSSKLCQT